MPDPTSLEDQVQALTKQLTALDKRLTGDLERRFEELNDQIDQQNTRFKATDTMLNQALSDLEEKSVAHRVSLPFNPKLDGNWVGGTTSGDTPLITIPQGAVLQLQQLIINGSMPIALPDLVRIQAFQASFDFTAPAGPLQGGLSIGLQRKGLNAKNSEPVVDELSSGPGATESQGSPIPGRELVDNKLFEYSIVSVLHLITPPLPVGFPISVSQGLVVLKSFTVDCIAG